MTGSTRRMSAGNICGLGWGAVTGALLAAFFITLDMEERIDWGFKHYSYDEILFHNLDVDESGSLSPAEFAVVMHKITPLLRERTDIEEMNVTLTTSFSPLELSSLRSASDPDFYVDMNQSEVWQGLLQWQKAAQLKVNLTNRKLSYFLPNMLPQSLGVPWPLFLTSDVTENPHMRYDPYPSHGIQSVVEEILRAFHPRPFVQMRFGPQGGHAVLRATSKDHVDIVFRIHAEFQLNTPPRPPFWFTPAQFTGNIIMSHNGSRIHHFRMYVPTKHRLNVDMELVTKPEDPESLTVEIGFLPRMEISTTGTPPVLEEEIQAISFEECEAILDKTFNPFKQVEYYPLAEAFKRAHQDNKLVHSIVLWGALDDQSC